MHRVFLLPPANAEGKEPAMSNWNDPLPEEAFNGWIVLLAIVGLMVLIGIVVGIVVGCVFFLT
jgi:MFS superfamily sulfate permease-like transporter